MASSGGIRMSKYSVSYCSGATGFGWEQDYDRLDEFEDFIDEMRMEEQK